MNDDKSVIENLTNKFKKIIKRSEDEKTIKLSNISKSVVLRSYAINVMSIDFLTLLKDLRTFQKMISDYYKVKDDDLKNTNPILNSIGIYEIIKDDKVIGVLVPTVHSLSLSKNLAFKLVKNTDLCLSETGKEFFESYSILRSSGIFLPVNKTPMDVTISKFVDKNLALDRNYSESTVNKDSIDIDEQDLNFIKDFYKNINMYFSKGKFNAIAKYIDVVQKYNTDKSNILRDHQWHDDIKKTS